MEVAETAKQENRDPEVASGVPAAAACVPFSMSKQHSSCASDSQIHSVSISQPLSRTPSGTGRILSTWQGEPDDYLMKLLQQGNQALPSTTPFPALDNRPSKRQKLSTGGICTNGRAQQLHEAVLPQFGLSNYQSHGTGSSPTNAFSLAALPSSATSAPNESSAQVLKLSLGEDEYRNTRTEILKHQEMFMGQLFDLHRIVQLQSHLVSICDKQDVLHTELAALEAEQAASTDSRARATSQGGQSAPAMEKSGQRRGQAEGQLSGFSQLPGYSIGQAHKYVARSSQARPLPPAQQLPQQQPQHFQLPQEGFGAQGVHLLPGVFGRGYMPPYPTMPSWNMGRGGFSGAFAAPYRCFGMMGSGPTMDPLMAWYAMHYGHYAQAMQNRAHAVAANARMQAQEQQAKAAARQERSSAAASCEAPRWWQDPEKVFGVAANPAIMANPSNHHRPAKRPDTQTEATSKPLPKRELTFGNRRSSSQHEETGETSSKRRTADQVISAGSEPIPSAEAPQKAGSGISAFKKLPTKSPNMRRPPTRAESIGSEVSRSAAEHNSPADEGESSGVAHGAAKGLHSSGDKEQKLPNAFA